MLEECMYARCGSTYLRVLCAAQGRCNDDENARTVSIVITDSCPECEADHLDLQVKSTFCSCQGGVPACTSHSMYTAI